MGAGGAALKEGRRPRGAQRWRAGPRRGGARRAAAAQQSTRSGIRAGKRVSEEEEFARILTARSIRAEEGREREFDGRGEAPTKL